MGNEHPIQGLMKTAMESIKDMVDVNTIVGDAVHTTDGKVVIPLSRVAFGFAAGGSEFSVERTRDRHHNEEMTSSDFPFGGGSGAGVSVQPVGFLIVGEGQIRMLPVSGAASTDRLMDLAPTLMEFVQKFFDRDREPEGEDRATHSNPVRVTARKKITEETESL